LFISWGKGKPLGGAEAAAICIAVGYLRRFRWLFAAKVEAWRFRKRGNDHAETVYTRSAPTRRRTSYPSEMAARLVP
jgi:hypothetical protein